MTTGEPSASDMYIHQPTRVEAKHFTLATWTEVNQWLALYLRPDQFMVQVSGDFLTMHIETREGPRDCPLGYWIVRGTQGEFYPVAAEVFDVSYRPLVVALGGVS